MNQVQTNATHQRFETVRTPEGTGARIKTPQFLAWWYPGSASLTWRGSISFYRGIVFAWALVLSSFAPVAPLVGEDITFARPDPSHPISVHAEQVTRWQAGVYEVLHLQGNISISQQQLTAQSNEAILWVETPGPTQRDSYKIIAYLEGNVVIELPPGSQANGTPSKDKLVDQQWLGRFFTSATVNLNRAAQPLDGAPPEIFERAQNVWESGASVSSVRPAAYTLQQLVISPQTGEVQSLGPVFQDPAPGRYPLENISPTVPQPSVVASGGPAFQVQISARDSSSSLNVKSFTNPLNPAERVSTGVGGFRIAITSPDINAMEVFQGDRDRQLVILADNIVRWESSLPDGSRSEQFYLEGNVVFSKDRRVIHAQRMYYDVGLQSGTILKAEILTPVPQYRGLVRMKAEVVQQVDENNLQAYGTAVTSSRLGVPRYWLQSESVNLTRQQGLATDPDSLVPLADPLTGLPLAEDEYFLESRDNRVYFGGLPVFRWPSFKTSLNDPSIYLERLGINNDDIFGFQLTTGWDMYQLLGRKNPPQGTRWIGLLDYLSERGIGVGSEFQYQRDQLFGIPGDISGEYRSWNIRDSGLDVLGRDRMGLLPEEKTRGRIFGRHQHLHPDGTRLKAELGYISDRNFLEQFYEREWDTEKDHTTGFIFGRTLGTRDFNLSVDLQINDFFAQTSWLPRFDSFTLGQPLLGDRTVWFGHTHAGYGKLRAADPPTNASELAVFNPLPWEADVDGMRIGTRQEIDFPVQLGPWKMVPYLLGDATYWQEDLSGNDLTRVYGQVGMKASLPMWRTDPSIQSVLWNVNGLAHKVNFDFHAFYADASQDLSELPLYDPLDDDAQEHFRRRFTSSTFGLPVFADVPLPYDERYFALRSGMQSHVAAPSMEIADDLSIVRFGVRQRWQTKRGMPGDERVIDWITFDSQISLFPDEDENNFGQDFGMFDYDFRWHVGDRLSLVSDGYFDFFSQGLRTASFGANIGRPEIGNAYLGYRMIEGPISSNILSAYLVYRMSEKWGAKAGGQIDFGETGSIGQTVSFVYIGESFLWQFGVNHDVSRDNVGFRFGFEPRFLNRPRLFRPGGVAIPPAGYRYLE